MGVKSANLFEQHVEKIVLGVAAAGALYMAYLATQPIIIPGTQVTSTQVEDTVSTAVRAMEASSQANSTSEPPKIAITDYAADYRKLAQGEPLPAALLTAAMPQFGPKGAPVGGGDQVIPENNLMKVVTPLPADPEGLTATAVPQLVADAPLAAPGVPGAPMQPVQPLAGGAVLPTHDKNAVVVQGFVPVGKMLVEMLGQTDIKAKLQPQLQRAVIAKIKVERRERTANGFSELKEVTPTKGSYPATEIPWTSVQAEEMPSRLQQVDSEFPLIVLPTFYVDAHGVPIQAPILTQPLPAQIEREANSLNDQLTKARTSNPGGASPMAPGMVSMSTTPGAPGAAGTAGAPLDVNKLRETVVPFCFWDEDVLPDHQYQYQVTVEYVNPTYQWTYGLKNPEMMKEPLLKSKTVVISTPVKVHSDLVFFVTGGGSLVPGTGDHTASFKVFKKNTGKWYFNEFISQPGMGIGGRIRLVDRGQEQMEVDTGYTVVDVQNSAGGVHVVLRDAEGNLVPRDSNVDGRSQELKSLSDMVAKPPAPVAATPTTPGVTGGTQSMYPDAPNYVPPTAPRGTTSTPPRPTSTPTPVRPPVVTPPPRTATPQAPVQPRTAN